uniref:Calponin-homology (CH) domain-containing protein n=1 Tax=Myripristis murdjan TaxID=586833 RepID=A0A667XVG6_9TELE
KTLVLWDWANVEKKILLRNNSRVLFSTGYREAVQKRTFTRWMTVFLQRCEPPVEVHDLFTDIQDGRVLMALLEELSGCKLVSVYQSKAIFLSVFLYV